MIIDREVKRLALVQEQIIEIERERDLAPTPCAATERKRHQLLRLNGIGVASAPILAREVYYRQLGGLDVDRLTQAPLLFSWKRRFFGAAVVGWFRTLLGAKLAAIKESALERRLIRTGIHAP